MGLSDFLKSGFIGSQSLKLAGKDYAVSGTFVYADEEFVVLKGKDGNLHGIRSSLIEVLHTDETSESKLYADVSGDVQELNADLSLSQKKADIEEPEQGKATVTTAFKEFKPGDKIPLDELTSRDPKVASNWQKKEKNRYINNALSQRVSEAIEEIKKAERPEDDYELVAFGKIIDLQPGYLFGFIDDFKNGERYYFNKSDIADPKMAEISGKDIPVVYFRSQNHKGKAAKSIILPSTVKETLELAAYLITRGELYSAKQIVSNIIEVYPDNPSTLFFQEAYAKRDKTPYNGEADFTRESGDASDMFRFFKEGKRLMTQKDYRGAIQSFQTALDNGCKPESCIKEIILAYLALHARTEDLSEKEKIAKEGVSFVTEYRPLLPQDLRTLFTLENFYFALGDYEEHIPVVEDIIAECGNNNDMPQYVFYLNKAALSYMRLREYDKAMDAVMEGLEAAPTNPQLQKTQFTLMEEMSKGGDTDANSTF